MLEEACAAAVGLGNKVFTRFLLEQRLGPLWDECIESLVGELACQDELKSALHESRLHSTGDYLLQRHNLTLIKKTLDDAGIQHVVTKGGHVREVYYDEPALRPAQDIDVLIHPDDNVAAIRAFQGVGFEFHGVNENIAQDCSLL